MDDNSPFLLKPGYVAMLLDPSEFAYRTGKALRAISIQRKPDCWQIVLRAGDHNGGALYSLFAAVTLSEALERALSALSSKGGSRYWHPDKYG